MSTLEDLAPEARDELALLARQLADDPATRTSFLKLAKKARPNVPIPELEIDERIQRVEQSGADRMMALEAKEHERDAREELNRRRSDMRSKYNLSADEVQKVEKIMIDNGIQNHDTGAQFYQMQNQAAAPTPMGYSPNVMDKTAKDTLAKFWKNPASAARDEAANALDAIRKGGPRVLG
jgi:hypothetical protein